MTRTEQRAGYHIHRLGLKKSWEAKVVEWRKIRHLVTSADWQVATACGQHKAWMNVAHAYKVTDINRINCLQCLTSAKGRNAR